MSAGQVSARTVFEVKCLFAIDAIAAVYRADPARFEHAARTKLYGLCSRYWRRLERRRPPLRPRLSLIRRRKKPPGRRPPAQVRPRIPSPAAVRFGTFLSFRRGRGGAVASGRVIADWPGLRTERLYQGWDLYPTADLRGVLKGVLVDQFGLTRKTLAEAIFPDSARITPMKGLA